MQVDPKLYSKCPPSPPSQVQWPKNVVTNIVFQNCATFNFHQAILKEVFVN
jgi:hypothetical protein